MLVDASRAFSLRVPALRAHPRPGQQVPPRGAANTQHARPALPIRYPTDTPEAREPPPKRHRSATEPLPIRYPYGVAPTAHRGLARTRSSSNHADESPLAPICPAGGNARKRGRPPGIPLPNRYRSATLGSATRLIGPLQPFCRSWANLGGKSRERITVHTCLGP